MESTVQITAASSDRDQRLARALGLFSIGLGVMAAAWNPRQPDRIRLAAGAGAVLGVTVFDAIYRRRLSAAALASEPLEIHASIAIQSAPDRLYRFVRELSNLPRVFSFLHSLDVGEAQISEDVPQQRLAWRTSAGAALAHSARMVFKPLSAEGTLLSVEMRFEPRLRILGDTPKDALKAELRGFKHWFETREFASSEVQPCV